MKTNLHKLEYDVIRSLGLCHNFFSENETKNGGPPGEIKLKNQSRNKSYLVRNTIF